LLLDLLQGGLQIIDPGLSDFLVGMLRRQLALEVEGIAETNHGLPDFRQQRRGLRGADARIGGHSLGEDRLDLVLSRASRAGVDECNDLDGGFVK